MRLRLQPWQLAAGLIILCAAAVFGIYRLRTRGGVQPAEMTSYLPTNNAVVVYIDFESMRRSGILNLLSGSKAAEELEYQQFVDQTLFDYRQDLDAAAVAFKEDQVFFALRGRFHWKNLMDYTVRRGGACHNSFCAVEGSKPLRRISFYPLKPDLMAMAVSKDDLAAYQVARNSGRLAVSPPSQPVWILVPAAALKNAGSLPDAARPYAAALRNTEEVLFSVGSRRDQLQLSLQVACKDAISASALLVDLENATNALRKMIARQHQEPNPGDLTGVLAAGVFRREDRQVFGEWPIPRAFVDSITRESY